MNASPSSVNGRAPQLARWQRFALEQERILAEIEQVERERAIGDWAFADDLPERAR